MRWWCLTNNNLLFKWVVDLDVHLSLFVRALNLYDSKTSYVMGLLVVHMEGPLHTYKQRKIPLKRIII